MKTQNNLGLIKALTEKFGSHNINLINRVLHKELSSAPKTG